MANNTFLNNFRSGFKFTERLLRNITLQAKWIIRQARIVDEKISVFHINQTGRAIHPATSVIVKVGLLASGGCLFLLLSVWALLKSI